MNMIGTWFAVVFAVGVLTAAQAEAMPRWHHHGGGWMLKGADANGDGFLDAADREAHFDKMDRDHNGAISREEWGIP